MAEERASWQDEQDQCHTWRLSSVLGSVWITARVKFMAQIDGDNEL